MGFLCVKEYDYPNPSYNVYSKLRALFYTIKNESQIREFERNSSIIIRRLDNLINSNNKYLFTDFYIVFAFFIGCDSIYTDDIPVWPVILRILEKTCNDDIYETIFYYSSAIIFYANHNYSYVLPNDDYFRVPYEDNWQHMFEVLLRDDPRNRNLLNKFYKDLELLSKQYYKENKALFTSLSSVLCMITTYCIVKRDYRAYDPMFNKLIEDKNNISLKLELNNINTVVNTNRHSGEHPDIGKYIEVMLNLVKPHNKQKIIK